MNHWIKCHKLKQMRKSLKVELVFTDCASNSLIVDEFPYGDDDEFIFTAPFELIMESITLHDGEDEIWSDNLVPPPHMMPGDELRANFKGMGVWP